MTATQDRAGEGEAPVPHEVHDQLRRIARSLLARERPDHTLQATALVHEAWLRLAGARPERWRDERHFVAVAARCMRRLLVDHARGKRRDRRGGDRMSVELAETIVAAPGPPTAADLLALEAALQRLTSLDAREAHIVELRLFGGMTVPEIAETVGVSTRTVEDDWTHAQAWLRRHLAQGSTA